MDDRNLLRTQSSRLLSKLLINMAVEKVNVICMCMCKEAPTQSSKKHSLNTEVLCGGHASFGSTSFLERFSQIAGKFRKPQHLGVLEELEPRK